jgi:hypothetical protein
LGFGEENVHYSAPKCTRSPKLPRYFVGGRRHSGGMKNEMPVELRRIAKGQWGVISRKQALRAGLSSDKIKFRVRSGRWQCVYAGVYLTFTGKPGRPAMVWAAVLYAGRGAVLSHETAAELHGLTDKKADVVHVSVPHDRHVVPVPGARFHRSARGPGIMLPARTTVEDTVLDLVDEAERFDDACGWVTRAFARGLSDASKMRKAIASRGRLQWRADIVELIDAAAAGDESVLEFRYTRDVERAHGLPPSRRQVPFRGPGGQRGRRDRVYEQCRVIVELDGRMAHPPESKWHDAERDNAATADGGHPLRYGWMHVRHRSCVTAIEVGKVLRRHGWTGRLRPCSPGCPAGQT